MHYRDVLTELAYRLANAGDTKSGNPNGDIGEDNEVDEKMNESKV